MGTFIQQGTKESLVRELIAGTLDHALRGNTLYSLVEIKTGEHAGMRIIRVDLIRAGERVEIGYKPIDESMGPSVTDCPERLLAASTCTLGYAPEWREKCRAARREKAAGKKASAGWTEGKVLLWYGKPVTFLYHLPKGGKIAGRCSETGKVFAYRVSELREPEASAAA